VELSVRRTSTTGLVNGYVSSTTEELLIHCYSLSHSPDLVFRPCQKSRPSFPQLSLPRPSFPRPSLHRPSLPTPCLWSQKCSCYNPELKVPWLASLQHHVVITICIHSSQELCINGISCHNKLLNLVLLILSTRLFTWCRS